jgi:hypothetical protein
MEKRMRFILILLACLLLPLQLFADGCEILGKVGHVEVRQSGSSCEETILVATGENGTIVSSVPYEEVLTGIRQIWDAVCDCYIWQISGIGGGHTLIVRFFRENTSGALHVIDGGVFGSEISRISIYYRDRVLHVEVQDAAVDGTHKSKSVYRFTGKRFIKGSGR